MATIDELGLTPYQRIMGQMTPTMNPYTGADVAVGGYDPALYRRASGSGLINSGFGGLGGLGGGGGGSDYSDPNPAWSNMTQAERASYYAANPTMASVTKGLQGLFGNTLYGKIQNYFNPNFVTEEGLIAMGVNPATYQNAKEGFRASEIAAMNAGYPSAIEAAQSYGGASMAEQQAMNDAIAAAADANQGAAVGGDVGSISDQNTGGDGGGYGGYSDSAGSDSFGGGEYNMGGLVDRVGGPNPAGPDDGAGMLQLGEYVIKKSAVKKYGQGLLDMINDGKIPAKKMKSLLG